MKLAFVAILLVVVGCGKPLAVYYQSPYKSPCLWVGTLPNGTCPNGSIADSASPTGCVQNLNCGYN